MNVLVLNSGSSSHKSALYQIGDSLPSEAPQPEWKAQIEWSASSAKLQITSSRGSSREESVSSTDRRSAMEYMLRTLWDGPDAILKNAASIDVVGHRIVHGGQKLVEPTIVTPEVKRVIASVAAFAPLHNRAELEGIEIIERLIGKVQQVAVFDTGFHRTMPPTAYTYPGPYEWLDRGIRRYGFHGINHEYCSARAAQLLNRDLGSVKIVSCHLGNGCSLAAIAAGRSVDTTMGFTPLDGLMMGTRSGSVDPGILTYLMREESVTGAELDETLNKKCGLLGISGVSGDMRGILAAIQQRNQRAKLAFDMFVHRLRQGIAAMAASLQGVNVLLFTAGVGEHSPEIRKAACQGLTFLGIQLDAKKNAVSSGDQEISTSDSDVKVLVIRAQEDWAIAKACALVLARA
jgi:acetate kinase